jgi:signal recognition particle GTPase
MKPGIWRIHMSDDTNNKKTVFSSMTTPTAELPKITKAARRKFIAQGTSKEAGKSALRMIESCLKDFQVVHGVLYGLCHDNMLKSPLAEHALVARDSVFAVLAALHGLIVPPPRARKRT